MADTINIGALSKFAYAASGSTYTTLARLGKITPPSLTVGTFPIEASDNAQQNGLPVEDSGAAWVTRGDVTAQLYSLQSIYSTLQGIAGIAENFAIQFPAGDGYLFKGFIKELKHEWNLKTAIITEVGVHVNGTNNATVGTNVGSIGMYYTNLASVATLS